MITRNFDICVASTPDLISNPLYKSITFSKHHSFEETSISIRFIYVLLFKTIRLSFICGITVVPAYAGKPIC